MQTKKHIDISDLRILLAVSSAWDLRQITSMLRSFGAYNIISCHNGDEALDGIESHYPDLTIISDGLTGLPATKVIHATRRHRLRAVNHTPIIYIANVLRRSDIEQVARLGVHEIVCRPFSTKTLIDRVYWTSMVRRPFIRTETYFGPEPRTRIWKSIIGLEPPPIPLDEAVKEAKPSSDAVFEL